MAGRGCNKASDRITEVEQVRKCLNQYDFDAATVVLDTIEQKL